ncbi:MAG: AAA family ATPase, partial [Myxococcota bacterium]
VELVGLDLGLLKAGAGVKGELENRLKKVIAEVKGSPTPIIVFIDEAHTLIGGAGDAGDIPNLLKPALARGEFRTVAATTWAEFKKYFEKDAALERRFQPVQVDQPSVEDAAIMLRGLRETYEKAHKVTIRDDAVVAAVELSERYISGRQLPDKAVDLLDTASARVRIEQAATPAHLTALHSEAASLNRQLSAYQRDLDDAATVDEDGQVAKLKGRLAEITTEVEEAESRLEKERAAIEVMLATQAALRDALAAPTAEEGNDDPPDEAKIAELREAVSSAREVLAEVHGEEPLVHAEVDRHAVAQVIADWTGIPVGKMNSSTIETILNIEESMKKRIKGQDDAVATVAEMIRMAHAGVRNPDTPIAVMLFVGPSGVGKTETALALADLLYGGDRSMVTINMSEFQEKHTVSRLIGSPPGYVGYGEGGLLTEAVRAKPYSVVLLDEVEKADLEVMNLFYQVFDKGILNDSEGRAVNFRNTVVILTSNLATQQIMDLCADGRPDVETIVETIRPPLSKHFKPALLARMTVVPYGPMDPEILTEIAHLKLGGLIKRLERAHGMTTTFDDSLVAELVSRCTEGETGARALDHAMRGSLMPVLARGILERMAGDGLPKSLEVGLVDGEWDLRFS